MATKKATTTENIVLNFELERETKGTRRYAEQDVPAGGRAAVGTLYLTKPYAEKLGNPDAITVTIEVG